MSAKGQLNFLVITGGVCPFPRVPGAQPGKDSQGLLQIVSSPHDLKMSAKGQFNLLVITGAVLPVRQPPGCVAGSR